jgi:hypothetical protein
MMLSPTAVPAKYLIYEPGGNDSFDNGNCAESVICQAVTFIDRLSANFRPEMVSFAKWYTNEAGNTF